MNMPHTSTADVALPYKATQEPDLAAAKRLGGSDKVKPQHKTPLFGTQILFMRDTLSSASNRRIEPFFGNRLRWALQTIRDIRTRHRS